MCVYMYKLLKNINFPSFVFIFFLKLLADYIALHIKRNVKIHNFYSNFTFILEPRPSLSRVDAPTRTQIYSSRSGKKYSTRLLYE